MKLSRFQNRLCLIGLITTNCWLWLIAVAGAESNLVSVTDPKVSETQQLTDPIAPTPKLEITQQLAPVVIPAPIKIGAPSLSVGLMLNDKSVLDGINVRGYEDGAKAVDFDRWLIPFDDAMKAMGVKIKELGKGDTVELISSSFRVNFDTRKLLDDPVLGRSISIKDLRSIGGIKAEFDLYKYAIAIKIPTRSSTDVSISSDTPIDLDGLPIVSAGKIGLGAIQQRSNVSGASNDETRTSGELRAVGNIGTGTWQVRIDQPTLEGINNWNLNSATAIFPSKATDLAIGSQQPFWGQSGSQTGSYWGVTTISRIGFVPPATTSSKSAAIQIDVIAGTTTDIPVPLIPAYAITGVAKNSAGTAIIGGRVEAIASTSGEKYTSVTNDSGIYYLEGLEQGEYRVTISGLPTKIANCKSACDERIRITAATNPVQELNLMVPQAATITPPKSTTSFNYPPTSHLTRNINILMNY